MTVKKEEWPLLFKPAITQCVMLFPDINKPHNHGDDFIWASPVPHAQWRNLLTVDTTETENGMRYAVMQELAVIMRRGHETDDDCLEAAAWLRFVVKVTKPIYVVERTEQTDVVSQSMSAAITRTAGVNPKQVRMIYV